MSPKKCLTEVLIFLLTLIFSCLFFFDFAYSDPLTAYEDTMYFEPAPESRVSADGDTFYINPGQDVKINFNLKNVHSIIAFRTGFLKDKCYDGNIFLNPEKNNSSANPICYQGGRVEYWDNYKVINFNLYPPYLELAAGLTMADPLPSGDGLLATLTFTAFDTGCIHVDTAYMPGPWEPPYVVDPQSIGYTVEFIGRTFYVRNCPYLPGDLNCDLEANVLDVQILIHYLFRNGETPCPLKAADVNCDEVVSVSDAVYLIVYLFRSGPAPQICEY